MGCGPRISHIDKSLKSRLVYLGLDSGTLLVMLLHQGGVTRVFLSCVKSPVLE